MTTERIITYRQSIICKECGQPLERESSKQLRKSRKYCSDACKSRAYRMRKENVTPHNFGLA